MKGLYNPGSEHDACGVGLLVNTRGEASHDLVEHALKVLEHMAHRGGEREDTGDGAGIQVQIPRAYYGIEGAYGTGMVFLPTEKADELRTSIDRIVGEMGLQVVKWRDVPVCRDILSATAKETMPDIRQVFVNTDNELKLYLLRKRIERELSTEGVYIPSLSAKVIVYKGLLSSTQLRLFYPDLTHPEFESAIALVHSRFSTNTFPTWSLAQPFRLIGHNGEINTIRGNRKWMEARESVLEPKGFQLEDVLPILQPGMSDSASLDNVLEFFVAAGMSLPHALAMLVPESYNDKNPISPALKAFYEYHSILMEAWDGPATLLFSDGRYAGGMLDRNGLRPARYVITNHDTLIIASETGVLNLEANNVTRRGRLRPGKMLMVDTCEGRILFDSEIKSALAKEHPYGDWLALNRLNLKDVSSGRKVANRVEGMEEKLRWFGYTEREIEQLCMPMFLTAAEPTGAMGNDTPAAPFSTNPKLLFDYFRQQFAQVTNPPIDPIREALVMSLGGYIGRIGENVLCPSPNLCKMVKMSNPILTNKELDLLRNLQYKGFRTIDIDLTFEKKETDLQQEVERVCHEALEAVKSDYNYLILTDKAVSEDRLAIPSLLATAAVHNYLIQHRQRVQTAILVEAGDVREVMHFALLMGYGASAVNPYLALSLIDKLATEGKLGLDFETAEKHYIKALDKGLMKIISKMGISTMGSYKGAQLFEALGLNEDVLNTYFGGTTSSFSGVGLDRILDDLKRLREPAEKPTTEVHAWTPQVSKTLREAVAENSEEKYRQFAELCDQRPQPIFIRDYLKIKPIGQPIAIGEVEPAEAILPRLVAGAISFGAISTEAHQAIAMAMNRIGSRSNTGEGGEDRERMESETRSKIKQIASGRFGVTAEYLMSADEIQIKIAQGAKPGEGGQLPGYKVDEVIAKVRHAIPGLTLISPPPHHDIYSIEDLAELIFDIKTLNPKATVSVKLVSESGVGTIAAGVAKAKADNIVICGACGGTGASPLSSTYHAGVPLEIGLAEAEQTLLLNGLRDSVVLQADGELKTGRDIIVSALLGAEEYAIATALMISMGCIYCRKCHTNTCPTGIATQDKERREKFCGINEAADRVERYLRMLAEDVRQHLAEMGAKTLDEIIGRPELLEAKKNCPFDFGRILAKVGDMTPHAQRPVYNPITPMDPLNARMLIESQSAIETGTPLVMTHEIKNTYRAIGTNIAGEIAKRYGNEGLPDSTVMCIFDGSAGQSFGAFLTKGMYFLLQGDANDYVGKGLSGGRIAIMPPAGHLFQPEENVIAGNTALYGATSGEFYACGQVGERFCVRNSGAMAVVEGVGDHACEYMTGGRVVVLGPVGRNFAAGMSGGIAYIYNPDGDFDYYCNMEMVELTLVEQAEDEQELRRLIEQHVRYTGSPLAGRLLADWENAKKQFIKVMPTEYRAVMERQALQGAE